MLNFKIYFTNTQVILLMLGLVSFLFSLYFHLKEKEKLSVAFLVITAVFVFCFAALLDPFLNLWDERFHALVGKNLVKHPWVPTLYDDAVVHIKYDRWDRYRVWLHKPPLFLWQIALSFKLFGVSEFTLRIPDIILGAFLVFIGYRSGKLMVNQRVGYLTGVLIISSFYLVELVSGRQNLDHNDFSFLVYISLSIWSFLEYYYTGNKYWIYLVGLFSGMAIMCKWLVGLLVYLAWFILKLQQKQNKISQYYDLLTALLITVMIALPWQILTSVWYPRQSFKAFMFNVWHFTSILDERGGDYWFHFRMFDAIYGEYALFLIIPAFVVLYRVSSDKKLVIALLAIVLSVYLFFTLAATKMSSFTVVVAMVILIAFASLIDFILRVLSPYLSKPAVRNFIFVVTVLFIVSVRFKVGLLEERHTSLDTGNVYYQMLLHNKNIFKSLTLPANSVLFNVKGRHYIEAMFYTGLPAYNIIPTLEQCRDLKEKGRRVAIFKPQNTELPEYLRNDPSVIVIDQMLRGYE